MPSIASRLLLPRLLWPGLNKTLRLYPTTLSPTYFSLLVRLFYKDGEESAIGSYSKLAVPRPSIYGASAAGYGIVDYVDNVCVINHGVDNNLPDMARVRIIARNGNDGAFFIVDEFDPKESITREN